MNGTTTVPHTVDVKGQTLSGLLVSRHGKRLGYVWQTGSVWRYRTDDGTAYGERVRLASAVETLEAIATVDRLPRVILTDAPDVTRDTQSARDRAYDVQRVPTSDRSTSVKAERKATPVVTVVRASTPIAWNDDASDDDATSIVDSLSQSFNRYAQKR